MDKCKCETGNCGHWSDCAVHNEPAMPNGPCNCDLCKKKAEFDEGFREGLEGK